MVQVYCDRCGRVITGMSAHERVSVTASGAGWNGKNQHVEPACCISYLTKGGFHVNVNHNAIGNNVLAFVGTSGVQLGWLASQADMLADDWMIVEG